MSQIVAKWAKDALNIAVFSADTIEVLLKILDADCGKVVSSNQLLHWRAGILANAVRKPGRPGLLCFNDGRNRVSRLSNMRGSRRRRRRSGLRGSRAWPRSSST